MSDIDSLLDGSIDDIADLPEFKTFPAGAYNVRIEFAEKEINAKSAIELKLECISVIELNDSTAEPPAPGDETTQLFQLDNEFGQGKFKNIIKVLAAACGTKTARETMEAAQGMEVKVLTTIRHNKDKTQTYTEVAEMSV